MIRKREGVPPWSAKGEINTPVVGEQFRYPGNLGLTMPVGRCWTALAHFRAGHVAVALMMASHLPHMRMSTRRSRDRFRSEKRSGCPRMNQ